MAGPSQDQWRHTLVAFNTATESENKIHSDEVASTFGFTGGLVPGVDVYAYLAHLPARRWGIAWLRGGTMKARFHTPVYDGDEVTVVGTDGDHDGDRSTAASGATLSLELSAGGGQPCATASATLDRPPNLDWDPIELAPTPSERPRASAATLAKGTVLAPFTAGFHADNATAYLADVREELLLYRVEGVAHPGWLLRFANWVLTANVRLGPWIHVGSDATHLDVARDGEQVEARAVVVDEYERSGHRFVVLDVAITADGRPVQRVRHTAIYEPRRGPKPA